jgi:hypothetical protein
MHETLDLPDTNVFGVEFSDTLTEDDYDAFVSTIRGALKEHTTARTLLVMDDVNDWTPEERWEELSFDVRHLSDLDKVAIVGDDLWDTWLEKAEVLFPMSEIRTYAEADREEALEWIRGDMEVPGVGPGSVADPKAGAQDQNDE